jgi:hypothetical protein
MMPEPPDYATLPGGRAESWVYDYLAPPGVKVNKVQRLDFTGVTALPRMTPWRVLECKPDGKKRGQIRCRAGRRAGYAAYRRRPAR